MLWTRHTPSCFQIDVIAFAIDSLLFVFHVVRCGTVMLSSGHALRHAARCHIHNMYYKHLCDGLVHFYSLL
jgi:hypothetical protein